MMDNSDRGSRTRTPFVRVQSDRSLGELSVPERIISRPRTREIIAWCIIAFQACALAAVLTHTSTHSTIIHNRAVTVTKDESALRGNPFSINNKPPAYHEDKMLEATSVSESTHSFYDPPTIYPARAGLVSRVWHSNGSPQINQQLQQGSCWCSGDDYCMCTPSLAIDVVLTSGPDHVWLVERADNGKFALMGGFVEVGETVENAVQRELQEELSVSLPGQAITLIGVYSDPKRDARKHSVSVVYTMEIPPNVTPSAGDDATKVVRVPLSSIDDMDVWIDHKTVLRDFVKSRKNLIRDQLSLQNDGEPFKRSLCPASTGMS